MKKTLDLWLTNIEKYKMGKVPRAGYRNKSFKFAKKRKKISLNPLNHILVLHLGQGVNFLTMFYTAKVTLPRKPLQYLWTFMLSTTYCRPLHGTHQSKRSHMNFRCMREVWTSMKLYHGFAYCNLKMTSSLTPQKRHSHSLLWST